MTSSQGPRSGRFSSQRVLLAWVHPPSQAPATWNAHEISALRDKSRSQTEDAASVSKLLGCLCQYATTSHGDGAVVPVPAAHRFAQRRFDIRSQIKRCRPNEYSPASERGRLVPLPTEDGRKIECGHSSSAEFEHSESLYLPKSTMPQCPQPVAAPTRRTSRR